MNVGVTDASFSIDRETGPNGAVILLRLSGEFDRAARPALQRAVLAALAGSRATDLVVDVAATTLIDQESVDALLVGYVAALRHGHGYRVINPRRRVRRILEPAGLLSPGRR